MDRFQVRRVREGRLERTVALICLTKEEKFNSKIYVK